VFGGPTLHLRTEPKPWPTTAEIQYRPWHVLVASQVLADTVAIAQIEDLSDVLRVDKVLDGY